MEIIKKTTEVSLTLADIKEAIADYVTKTYDSLSSDCHVEFTIDRDGEDVTGATAIF
jgi:hypothetical protein